VCTRTNKESVTDGNKKEQHEQWTLDHLDRKKKNANRGNILCAYKDIVDKTFSGWIRYEPSVCPLK
jgi:hypothetical protein